MHENIPIDDITRRARTAAESGLPFTACPYPAGTPAAERWRFAYLGWAVKLLDEVPA